MWEEMHLKCSTAILWQSSGKKKTIFMASFCLFCVCEVSYSYLDRQQQS